MAFRTHLYTIIHQDDTYEFYIKCDLDGTIRSLMRTMRHLKRLVTKSNIDNSETYDIVSTDFFSTASSDAVGDAIMIASENNVHIKAADVPSILDAEIRLIFIYTPLDQFRSRVSMKFDAEYKRRVQEYMQTLAPDDLWRVRNIIETSQEQLRPFQHRIDIIGDELRFDTR